MNEGQTSIEQAPAESETDFLKRLADVALIEEDLTRASLYNTNELKKNLKTIIKSEWKIENLVKSFNNDNQFLLNKTFALPLGARPWHIPCKTRMGSCTVTVHAIMIRYLG
jgi:hypothetical protein